MSTRKLLVSSSTLHLSIKVPQTVRFGLAVFLILKCRSSGEEWANLVVSSSWQSTSQAAIVLCLSEYLNIECEITLLNIKLSQQVLEFAIPHLMVRVPDTLCKYYKQICNVTGKVVDMVYKRYKQIRSVTVQWTNWWELPYGLLP